MSGKRAIIVDDDQHVLSFLSELVELAGFSVRGFLCPVEALDYLRQHGTDVVLTDYKMPKMDGLLFSRELRKISDSIPIMIITAEADNFLLKAAAATIGISDIFGKPVDFSALLARLQDLLK